MSLLRSVIVIGIAVALVPSDPRARNNLAQQVNQFGAESASFCQRNPNTCAAAVELGQAFVEKSQYALELASQATRSYMDSSQKISHSMDARPDARAEFRLGRTGGTGQSPPLDAPIGLSREDRLIPWRDPRDRKL